MKYEKKERKKERIKERRKERIIERKKSNFRMEEMKKGRNGDGQKDKRLL